MVARALSEVSVGDVVGPVTVPVSRETLVRYANASLDQNPIHQDESFARSYQAHRDAYIRIFDRFGFDYVIVEAMTGAMGGSASEEFLATAENGEDTYVRCTTCDYAANVEAVQVRPAPPVPFDGLPAAHVEDTPDTTDSGTAETVAAFSLVARPDVELIVNVQNELPLLVADMMMAEELASRSRSLSVMTVLSAIEASVVLAMTLATRATPAAPPPEAATPGATGSSREWEMGNGNQRQAVQQGHANVRPLGLAALRQAQHQRTVTGADLKERTRNEADGAAIQRSGRDRQRRHRPVDAP